MSSVASERVLPHNLEAERSVFGAVLVTLGRAMDQVVDRLTPEMFFRDAHRQIFTAMLGLYARNEAIDFVTLKEVLGKAGKLDECGGPVYIAGLADGMPSSTNIAYYAGIIREKAQQRGIIYAANKLLTAAYEQEDPIALIDFAERTLLDVSVSASPGDLVSSSDMVRNIYPVLEQLTTERRPVTGVSTGLARLDKYTRGLQPGNLVIMAARTSQGKSTLATQMALHVSQTAPVAFFSLEMSQQEQMFRVISTIGHIDGHALQCGQLSMLDMNDVGRALTDFESRKFWFDDSPSLSALQIRSRARRLKAKHGLGLIVVDYLQLLKHPKAERQDLAVGETAKLLLATGRELGVPVLALCQLSRAVEQRQDQRPRLSDLRESGNLEQDAHVVFLIHRQAAKDGATDIPPTELIIAKQRNGPTASVDLLWLGEQYRFGELEAQR